jgi:type II secretory ATPase GspE/PulE/Tfp pilus assembly ATPase PilB-like protein
VHRAEEVGASDIHLQMNGQEAQVFFRLDGVMTPAAKLEAGVAERVFGRIKYLARLKTYQELLPQEGRIEKTEMSSRSDIRVATYPTVTGEKIVLRLFVAEEVKRLDDLQFPPETIAELKHFLKQTSGRERKDYRYLCVSAPFG